ncbi:P-loop ATPase, Sll1717 family [Kangiella geojedonensis]|uniref:FunZ protein n=1 Tax=Kangiella geojedonensis TaxID=914150 RepID=A0A0F6TQ04_9GAMM|nr:hypothetical protein [Kangiella geojedonensis]AKE51805.1 hypothetical protein TQ33_0833 [Kangiella geojedonensis]
MGGKLLEEIEDWKLEAKLENNNKYFFHTRVVNKVVEGKKSYVIGRKGTGKTAISEYLVSIKEDGYFAQKLTFKNFPFNKLYELSDDGYNEPNQYITVWKYLIYSTVCQMLSKNENVDLDSREKLEKLFNHDLTSALPNAVNEWTGFKFDIKVLGNGIGLGSEKKTSETKGADIAERVRVLEQFIEHKLGKETYVVLFDELDEDYKDIIDREKYKKYTDLLTSLFKAVQDIKAKFNRFKFYPVIFLRDDIYDILLDPDKNKWTDYKISLEWSRDNLKNLLAFRISRAVSLDSDGMNFQQAWSKVFKSGDVRYGNRGSKSMSIFNYITRCTQNRPRDFIRYLQICAELSLERGQDKVTPSIVKTVAKPFSNYLKTEMEDEIHGALPEIKKIFNLFTKLRKQTLNISEFEKIYNAEVSAENIPKRDYQFILEMLFMFSVIGNVTTQKNHQVFRYQNKDARLNMNEQICVHRGLYRALQIL